MSEQTTLTLPGAPDLQVALRRSARARRISLKVSRLDGAITLTLPLRTPRRQGECFLAEREAWLRSALVEVPTALPVTPGAILPVQGQSLELVRAPGRGVRRLGDQLILPLQGHAGRLTGNWLKLQARNRILPVVTEMALALGAAAMRPPGRLRLSDPRGRWGSCAASGNLMLSWRLMLAPPEVLDYVIAHEVAHLAQMNHSPAFWATVERLMPEYHRHRAWLRTNGAGLHRFDFEA